MGPKESQNKDPTFLIPFPSSQTSSEECRTLRGQLEEQGRQLQATKEAEGKLKVGPSPGAQGRCSCLPEQGPAPHPPGHRTPWPWACRGGNLTCLSPDHQEASLREIQCPLDTQSLCHGPATP